MNGGNQFKRTSNGFRDIEDQVWFLRNAIRFHTANTVQYAFRVCAILHYMFLVYDENHDAHHGDESVFWEGLDPNLDDIEALYKKHAKAP